MMDYPRRAAARLRSRRPGCGGAGRGAAAMLLTASSLLLVGLTLAGGTARADDWTTYRGDAQHTGVASEKVQPPLSLLWRFTAGPEANNASSPAIVGDVAYFTARASAQGGGVVYAVDTKTGEQLWSSPELQSRNIFSTSPLVNEGKIYIGASDGKLYVFDAKTGHEILQFTTGRTITSSPVIEDNVLYFGSNDGIFRAVNPETGASVWRQPLKVGDGVNSAPIIAGNLIYFTTNSNTIYAVNKATGIVKWANRLQFQFGPNAAIFADGTLYIPSGPRLHALQQTSGNFRWARDFASDLLFTPVAADGVVYVVDRDKNLHAVRASNGRDADGWKTPVALPYTPSAGPILSGDTIYIPTRQGVMLGVSRVDGKITWQYHVDPSVDSPSLIPPAATSLTAPVAISQNTLYMVSDDGSLSAFRPDATDTTPPLASHMYPPPGYSVNGAPGLIIALNLSDPGSGLDPDSVQLVLDHGSKPLKSIYDSAANIVYYRSKTTGKLVDPPLSNGRHTVTVIAKDYKGNELQQDWSFVVDNTLPQGQVNSNTPAATLGTNPAGGPPGAPGGGPAPGGYPGGYPGAGGGRRGGGRGGRRGQGGL